MAVAELSGAASAYAQVRARFHDLVQLLQRMVIVFAQGCVMIQNPDQGSASGTGHIVITGNVRGSGIFAVEGKVIGNVEVETLIVSAGGQVEGNLKAATVEVRGNVKGNITARAITLQPSSQVCGDLNFEQLAIAQGASYEGRCTPKA